MTTTSYVVEGMTCDHCAAAVTREIGALDGVTSVDVNLGSGGVVVESDHVLDAAVVQEAIEEAGYVLKI